ncbi:hypothetical protein TNCV_4429531 [Trichonephila clavipes]|nr:hypothetical protein TNCV_4429531 [Trichonephila clavipes]
MFHSRAGVANLRSGGHMQPTFRAKEERVKGLSQERIPPPKNRHAIGSPRSIKGHRLRAASNQPEEEQTLEGKERTWTPGVVIKKGYLGRDKPSGQGNGLLAAACHGFELSTSEDLS